MTITNQQVKLLMKKLKKHNQEVSAAKSGMSANTARKYIKSGQLPTEMSKPHTWKTRVDVFTNDWDELAKMLERAPGLEAKTLLNYLMARAPEQYNQSHLRTLQRRVRDWRAAFGAEQAVIFRQHIQPGKQSQSDFTCMNSLNITINGQPFKHLLFHFILTYSRWESIKLCFSERFESLVSGFEKAVWELGYVAGEHRTDNLTAATKAMGSRREFTERWQMVMAHYQIKPTTNNPGVSHENGSIEKSHDLLKSAIDQTLMVRGSRDFLTQKDYIEFLQKIVDGRNAFRMTQFEQEEELLQELPDRKWNSPEIVTARVSSGSIIQLLDKPYSVPSRLIHYTLKAYIYPEEIILFYGNKQLQVMPRNYSDGLEGINYRHLIDALVRKPSAFANYRYQGAFFPRSSFRKAYDELCNKRPASADRIYLKILQCAKIQSEQQVALALDLLLEAREIPLLVRVKELIDVYQKEKRLVTVMEPSLADYDSLLNSYRSH